MYNWECVVKNGFGDKNNVYAWSIKEFKNNIYIGTLNYKGCQIYRSKTGDYGTWKKVGIDGFDKKANSAGIRNMIVYNDLLWAATGSWNHGAQVWVTNGEQSRNKQLIKWKKANENGFGDGKFVPTIRSLSIFKDKLYVGTRSKNIPRIYRYDGSPDFDRIDSKKWTCINKDWEKNPEFDPYLLLAGQLIVFNPSDSKEYLYVGIYIDAIPLIYQFFEKPSLNSFLDIIRLNFLKCEIWRYDGKNWKKMIKKGFGKTNIMVLSAQILNNSLYYSTHNMLGGEIWKTEDGINFKQIVKRGFNNPFNFGFWIMNTFNDRLIIGTQNPLFGCQIWASKTNNPDGKKDFIKINENGMIKAKYFNLFSIRKQDGVSELEPYKDYLYAGTASWMSYALKKASSGCEVWRISKNSKCFKDGRDE